MVGTLALAGAISGLAHVGIYEATKPRIEQNRADALDAAIYRVLPGAKTRKAYVMKDGVLTAVEGLPKGEPAVYAGYDAAGSRVGFAVPADSAGFADTIRLLYGFDPLKQVIVGMEVLESKETPGLGDKIFKDAVWVGQFKNLSVDPSVVPTKPGTRSKPNEVDTISGATISTKAVIKAVNDGNTKWLPGIRAAASEGR
jgi:electron transport complex protein RnfG